MDKINLHEISKKEIMKTLRTKGELYIVTNTYNKFLIRNFIYCFINNSFWDKVRINIFGILSLFNFQVRKVISSYTELTVIYEYALDIQIKDDGLILRSA